MTPPVGASRVVSVARQANAIPDSGVSRWTFDDADTDSGTAVDVWGDNDGVINGATTGIDGGNVNYDTGEGYRFDGTDDFVDPSPIDISNKSELSLATWFKTTDTSDQNAIASWGENSSYGDQSLWVADGNTNASEGNLVYWFTDGSGLNRVYGGSVADGVWHHGTVTWVENGQLTLYVDGSEIDSKSIATKGDVSTEFHISEWVRQDNFLDVDISDFRIYDKALSPSDVSNLHNTGSIDG